MQDAINDILHINSSYPHSMIESIVIIKDCDARKHDDVVNELATWFSDTITLENHKICKYTTSATKAEEDRKKQEEARQELQRMERLRSASLIENRLKNANLATFQQNKDNAQLYKIVRNYVQNFDEMYRNNQGLLLYGPVGTGKSYAAACIANELLNQKIPVIMTSFVKILQMIQDKQVEESELIARLNNAKLLIIDDLGTERNTDYGLEKVYNVIDSRYLAGKPLILTTNLMLTDMKENMDTRYKRIYDRIFAMCFPHRVAGASWRMNQAADRYDEMRKRLLED